MDKRMDRRRIREQIKRFQKPLILLGVMLIMTILQPKAFPTWNNMPQIMTP